MITKVAKKRRNLLLIEQELFKIKKYRLQPKNHVTNILIIEARKLNDIQEVNIFKDDNTVVHFKKPSLEYSPKEKVSFLTGPSENKHIKDLLPNILRQLGPKQFDFMKDYAETLKGKEKKDTKIDEAPELVEDFEEVSKNE